MQRKECSYTSVEQNVYSRSKSNSDRSMRNMANLNSKIATFGKRPAARNF